MTIEKVWQDPNLSRRSVDPEQLARTHGSLSAWLWQLPWGQVARATKTGNQTGITTAVDVTGLSITWTAVANRLYVIHAHTMAYSSVGNDGIQAMITDASAVIQVLSTYNSPTNGYAGSLTMFCYVTPTPGQVTYKVRMQRSGGTGSVSAYGDANNTSFILAEDIGPYTP